MAGTTGAVGGGGRGGGGRGVKDRASPADFSHPPSSAVSGSGGGGGGGGKGGRRRRGERVVEKAVGPRVSAESKAVEEAYGPVDDGTRTEPPLVPVM